MMLDRYKQNIYFHEYRDDNSWNKQKIVKGIGPFVVIHEQ